MTATSPAAVPDDVVAWVQWPDLEPPPGVTLLSPSDGPLTPDLLDRVTFFVPIYMGSRESLALAARMPRLRVLQLTTAGYEGALEFVRPGVTLCNARGVHDASTAELAVGLAVAGRRGFAGFAQNQQSGSWRHETRPSLTDARIAVVGYGSIGKTLHRMLTGFEVTVVPFSRSGRDGAEKVERLPDLIGEFDVVILVLPLTAESTGMFDSDLLGRMKDGALLVNVARGGIVDTDALVAELTAGRVHAALDVTDPEPLPADHPLWHAPNVLITPHVGGDTSAFEPRARRLVQEQLRRYSRGEPLENVIEWTPPG
ncbi:MAG: D-3-phosphoglycerate dehydrogenase [Frankiales bacterium]|jgi:phosphoglycerate dehydrogenase-like enzyme|nr:D-3-phosphoglycerate dehydrogenase [Frankiales bacterium]